MAIDQYYREKDSPRRMSVRGLARAYSVPRMTLSDRLREKTKSVGPSSGRHCVFDTETEIKLVEHCVDLAQSGFGLTRMLIRKLAFQYAEKNDIKHSFHNTSKLAGVDWLTGFLHRHPEISVRSPEKLSAARASGMNKMTVISISVKFVL